MIYYTLYCKYYVHICIYIYIYTHMYTYMFLGGKSSVEKLATPTLSVQLRLALASELRDVERRSGTRCRSLPFARSL